MASIVGILVSLVGGVLFVAERKPGGRERREAAQ
jgi:hypothetical protein